MVGGCHGRGDFGVDSGRERLVDVSVGDLLLRDRLGRESVILLPSVFESALVVLHTSSVLGFVLTKQVLELPSRHADDLTGCIIRNFQVFDTSIPGIGFDLMQHAIESLLVRDARE